MRWPALDPYRGALICGTAVQFTAADGTRWVLDEENARSDGLRDQLLADYRRSLERWRIPGKVYDKEEALAAGQPVVVDSAAIMCALGTVGPVRRAGSWRALGVDTQPSLFARDVGPDGLAYSLG